MSADDKWWEKASHESTIQFGLQAIRCLMAANGGAVVALLTFLGNAENEAVDSGQIAPALTGYAVGLALAILTAFCSYLAQFTYTHFWNKTGVGFNIAAVLAAFLSLAAFVGSTFVASNGFS